MINAIRPKRCPRCGGAIRYGETALAVEVDCFLCPWHDTIDKLGRSFGQIVSQTDNPYQQCEVSPDCRACPLSRCKHDDPTWYATNRRRVAEVEKVEQTAWGTAREAAELLGVTERTVFRLRARLMDVRSQLSAGDYDTFVRLAREG